MATSMFDQHFWGDRAGKTGFDILTEHAYEGKEVLKEVVVFLNARIEIENQYVKAMEKLSKTTMAKTENWTFKAALQSLCAEAESQSKQHSEFAQQLNAQICKPLTVFKDEQKKTRKRIEKDGAAQIAALKASREKTQKSEEKYLKASKEEELCEQELDKAQAKGAADQVQKISTKLRKLVQEAEVAEKEYRANVALTQDTIGKYVEAMSSLFRELEGMEQQRYNEGKAYLAKFVEICSILKPQAIETVDAAVKRIDPETDVHGYATEKGTGKLHPLAPEFKPYDRQYKPGAAAANVLASVPALAQPAPSSPAVASAPSSAPSSAPPPPIGTAAASAATGAAPPSGSFQVRATHKYVGSDGELSFNEGDIIDVTEKDDSGWWLGMLGDRAGLFPSNYTVVL